MVVAGSGTLLVTESVEPGEPTASRRRQRPVPAPRAQTSSPRKARGRGWILKTGSKPPEDSLLRNFTWRPAFPEVLLGRSVTPQLFLAPMYRACTKLVPSHSRHSFGFTLPLNGQLCRPLFRRWTKKRRNWLWPLLVLPSPLLVRAQPGSLEIVGTGPDTVKSPVMLMVSSWLCVWATRRVDSRLGFDY